MKLKRLYFLSVVIVLLEGCADVRHRSYRASPPLTSGAAILKTALRSLNLAEPEADLKLNISNGDFRLIGIQGFFLEVPAIDKNRDYLLFSKCGVRILEGVGDDFESSEEVDLTRKAYEYAKSYNNLLVKYLASDHVP